jgi:hypothetical protein
MGRLAEGIAHPTRFCLPFLKEESAIDQLITIAGCSAASKARTWAADTEIIT